MPSRLVSMPASGLPGQYFFYLSTLWMRFTYQFVILRSFKALTVVRYGARVAALAASSP